MTMAVARTAPKCDICGEQYRGIYADRGKNFVGDSFIRWDIDGHKCDRSGVVYFCENTETNEWYAPFNRWTHDPLKAKFWRNREEANIWLVNNNHPWLNYDYQPIGTIYELCNITEHIFDNV